MLDTYVARDFARKKKMIRKNMYAHSASSRFSLLVILVALLVLLAACGGGSVASASPASTPTTVVDTPSPTPTAAPPTPTPVPQTPVSGSTQVIKIITNADGSFGFSPSLLTIKTGTTVIWKNVSSVEHSVTSDDGSTFDSGTFPSGKNFQFKFTASGSFPYHCNIHPYMRATIVVV
jgi:plastocyanin